MSLRWTSVVNVQEDGTISTRHLTTGDISPPDEHWWPDALNICQTQQDLTDSTKYIRLISICQTQPYLLRLNKIYQTQQHLSDSTISFETQQDISDSTTYVRFVTISIFETQQDLSHPTRSAVVTTTILTDSTLSDRLNTIWQTQHYLTDSTLSDRLNTIWQTQQDLTDSTLSDRLNKIWQTQHYLTDSTRSDRLNKIWQTQQGLTDSTRSVRLNKIWQTQQDLSDSTTSDRLLTDSTTSDRLNKSWKTQQDLTDSTRSVTSRLTCNKTCQHLTRSVLYGCHQLDQVMIYLQQFWAQKTTKYTQPFLPSTRPNLQHCHRTEPGLHICPSGAVHADFPHTRLHPCQQNHLINPLINYKPKKLSVNKSHVNLSIPRCLDRNGFSVRQVGNHRRPATHIWIMKNSTDSP